MFIVRAARLAFVVVALMGAAPAFGSAVDEGLKRSPGHYVAGLVEREEFEGCKPTPQGEICSMRVKLVDVYAFKSPVTDNAPAVISLLAVGELADKQIKSIKCVIFAVPVGDTGVYGATFSMCSPNEAAIREFKHAVQSQIP